MTKSDIPKKANRVLSVILLALSLILIRIWYLTTFEYDTYYKLAKAPRRKVELHLPIRGTIEDCFGVPLAVNKLKYSVSILYEEIREVPRVQWIKQGKKRVKVFPRKEHIQNIAKRLSKELEIPFQSVEDKIYGRAALFPSTKILIKDEITEKQYYKLKSLESDLLGMRADKSAKRFYPKGKVGADLIGYVGKVTQFRYLKRQQKIKTLENYLKEFNEGLPVFLPAGYSSLQEVKLELEKEKNTPLLLDAYQGKSGLEAQFEKDLRGHFGKTVFEVDTNGRYKRSLPGSTKSIAGKKLVLNISSELQEYAEKLLAENEKIRDEKFHSLVKDNAKVPTPWIKGGSIVAIEPNTGKVVCMASYPRMNNNDFIQKINTSKWLETPKHIEELWDGLKPLEKESYDFKKQQYELETKSLTLKVFLDSILSPKSSIKKAFNSLKTLDQGRALIDAAISLKDLSEQPYMYALIDTLFAKDPQSVFSTSSSEKSCIKEALSQHPEHSEVLIAELKKVLSPIKLNDDKLLLLDLIQLTLPTNKPELLDAYLSFANGFELRQQVSPAMKALKPLTSKLFQKTRFILWRQDCFRDYLKEKRREEKEKKTYQRSFLDHLEKAETNLFQVFWNNYQWELMGYLLFDIPLKSFETLGMEEALEELKTKDMVFLEARNFFSNHLTSIDPLEKLAYLKQLRFFKDLNDPLFGYYSQIKKPKTKQTLQDLAKAFYPSGGFGYGRSYAFRQATPLGSIFKVVTAYEAIKQSHENNPDKENLNPLTIIDEIKKTRHLTSKTVLGYFEDGKAITRRYKGGTLPRTHAGLGKIDYMKALERSSNVYFSLLASDHISDPQDLLTASLQFGYGNKTGISLPGEIAGCLPKDLNKNRSGLYSFAIGQHSLVATPLQTAIMLSSLGNSGEVLKPQVVAKAVGKEKDPLNLLNFDKDYPYKSYLDRVGIFFPFFIETASKKNCLNIELYRKQVRRKLHLPEALKTYLLSSLHSVVSSSRGNARPEVIQYLRTRSKAFRNYLKLRHQLAGKTSTAEWIYNPTLDRELQGILTTDIWFGALSFKNTPNKENKPELVVVVYLRFGDYGKEAAPLAAEIVSKYRELLKQHQPTL